MSPFNYNLSGLPNWSHLVDSLFSNSLLSKNNAFSIPAANVSEHEKKFILKLAVPGLEKKDFDISVDQNVLLISSKQRKSAETQEDNFTKKEYSYSSFKRSFALPENVKNEEVEANYKNGELIITLPKKELSVIKAKQIEVV